MRRSTVDKARESLRLQQVNNVLVRYGWDFVFDRLGWLGDVRRSLQAWAWHLPGDVEPVSPPVKVRMMLEELGPTYVKMGQIVSSQSSVIPLEWETELEKLQSEVPPFPSDEVRQILIEELGATPDELYAAFDAEPFAAASTAQVHRATLRDGTAVAVKVQRPGIQAQMKADIGIMQNAARVVSTRSDDVQAIDLVGMLEQFGSSVLRELDYNGEAYNTYRLGENLKSIAGVHVPVVYPEFSTSKVLTMEYIKGVKANDVEAIQASGLDRAAIATAALTAIIKMLLIDGFFHADPHPGNLVVNLETGVLTLLDCGMVGELEIQARINLIQFLVAAQQGDVQGQAQLLVNMSVPFRDAVNEKAFYKDYERLAGRYIHAGSQSSFGHMTSSALDLLREHGLRLDPNLTMAIKALTQGDAIVSALHPESGLTSEGVQIVKELGLQAVTAERVASEVKKQVMVTAREVVKRLPSLSDATLGWLDQYQKGRFEVHVDTSALAKEVNKISRLGRQVVIAVMLVGVIIGSAIAAAAIAVGQPEEAIWGFVSRVAFWGYGIATVVALLLVMRLIWRWLRHKEPEED
jgi:ubiquinone biosynthesis protein